MLPLKYTFLIVHAPLVSEKNKERQRMLKKKRVNIDYFNELKWS